VRYKHLPTILEQEGTSFYRHERRWQPKNLIPDPYRRNLLKDAQERLNWLDEAENELQTLVRAPLYMGALKRMRLAVRAAQFAWRTDDLKFLRSVVSFFVDYGIILRNLKHEAARGRFDESTAAGKAVGV